VKKGIAVKVTEDLYDMNESRKQRHAQPEDNQDVVRLQEAREAAQVAPRKRKGTYQPPALQRARKRVA
jgi:hypothetical protein